ncbi:hypothetical protein Tco_1098959, partial [Tanacetum coccineum]
VMPLSVILISSDSSEESVGSSTSRVILFGTIPAIIPTDVSTIVPAVPKVVAAAVVASPARIKAATRSSSSLSSTFTPPVPHHIIPALPDLPRRYAILVLPGQEIPFGRPYHTHLNEARMLLTARKRVHLLPTRIPANRMRFHSSSSSPPRKRRRVSPYSSSSAIYSSSPVFVGPSHKRCRSPTTDSLLIRADMFPPHKTLWDSSSEYHHEISVKDSTERDIYDSYEVDTESDIDSDILADIEADIAAEATSSIEVDTVADAVAPVEADVEPVEAESELVEVEVDAEPNARDTVEIAVDVVVKPIILDDLPMSTVRERLDEIEEVVQGLYEHLLDIPAQRLDDIEED